MKKASSILIASLAILLHSSAVDNPKFECDSSQEVVDMGLLNLHVLPNFLPDQKAREIQQWINEMCEQNRTYEDFDQRIGICWDDYWLERETQAVAIDPVAKIVTINGEGVEQKPESIFSYPAISSILLNDVLPQYFQAMSNQVSIPERVYVQTFVLRSILALTSNAKPQLVRWHRDPSEYDTIADYTLVLMLSDPTNAQAGWEGGELLVKNGLPADYAPALKVTPKYNQAVLFNNKKNSHMVTTIRKHYGQGTRDIMIVNIYLNDPKDMSV